MTSLKTTVMTAQQPPTPPPGNAELQYGLHHLVQHNNNMPYRFDGDDGLQYISSGPASSAYSSPVPQHLADLRHHHSDQYLPHHYHGSPFSDMQGSPEMGMPVQYVCLAEEVYGPKFGLTMDARMDMESLALHTTMEMVTQCW
jgi:hypothetical protein